MISIALLSVFRLQSQSIDLVSDAGVNTQAGQFIQERLTRIRCVDAVQEGAFSGDFGKEFPEVRYKEEIHPVPSIPNLFRVTVYVMFGPDPNPRLFKVETLLYKPTREDSP